MTTLFRFFCFYKHFSSGNSFGHGSPRTGMAQTNDGTIIFLVIDGRQPGYSIGATLYDVQQLLLAKGAITASNLDGGSSSILVKDNQVVNRPSSRDKRRLAFAAT